MPRPKSSESAPLFPETPPPTSSLFAGTSGWAYPTWKPGFYPPTISAKNFLAFYASQLNSVEVNYTFRTLPAEPQLQSWLAQTPPNFRFSFKAPQAITHFKRLKDCSTLLTEFLTALRPAARARKLGLLLFQLPPNFKADPARLQSFLADAALKKRPTPPVAFEFRHESWFAPETYAILRKHNVALCIADTDDLQTPEVHTAKRHTTFRLRRHGGYTPAELAAFAARFTALASTHDVYVYFRHEDEPTGALNARAFLQLTRGATP